MFDSLDEQIKADDKKASSGKEKIMEWVTIVVVSVLVFGGVIYAIRIFGVSF